MQSNSNRIRFVLWPAILILLLAMGQVSAQTTTSSIRGTVKDKTGAVPGAQVEAVETATGYHYTDTTQADGSFALNGLKPGKYDITITLQGYTPQSHTVTLLVGQNVAIDFEIAPEQLVMENVTVVGDTVLETKHTDIATNVTKEQIQLLPQQNRNFLNFAVLAPGVRVTNDEFSKQLTSGGLEANKTNVFIDGASFKNDVLEGGVVGQDSSRGNPFPQNAVQEFRVLTQNFAAEYEESSSSVITAVTKSGSNVWSGNVFLDYINDALVAQDVFSERAGQPKPALTQYQTGVTIGGPLIKNKLQMFLAYEDNRQDHEYNVALGNPTFTPLFGQYAGTFVSPFRSHLFFGKVSYHPSTVQTWDFSVNVRNESDERSFGGTTSFQAAEDVNIDVATVMARNQYTGDNWLNEASINFQRMKWNPIPLNPNDVGLEYLGIIRIGGRDTFQNFIQDRVALRDDYTFMRKWRGDHSFKTGAILNLLRYDVTKRLNGNPLFQFDSTVSLDFPIDAIYGVGNPSLNANNYQFGLYFQDDWNPTNKLSINAGLRWDYESDQLDNNYVTPDNVRAALTGLVPDNYFTDGSQRPAFKGAFQPRIGASYDLTGSRKHVVFGGYGRYYDRVVYNQTLDERFRLQWGVRTFRFSLDGQPRDGFPTIIWNPSYLSVAGLNQLIAQGIAPNPDVFLIANNTKPPYSDQWDIGYRQSVGDLVVSASYAGIRSHHLLTFIFGNRNPDGSCCHPIPGNFGNLLLSSDARRTWYDALYLTVEKPFSNRWGATLTYTLAKAKQQGGDLFSLDYPTVQAYPIFPGAQDERNRLVISGIYQFGYGIMVSGLATFGSGLPFTISDASHGFGVNEFHVLLNSGRPDKGYQSVDLGVQKNFTIAGRNTIGATFQVFNIFNHENFADYNGFIAPLPGVNPDFGKPSRQFDQRRAQFGVNYQF